MITDSLANEEMSSDDNRRNQFDFLPDDVILMILNKLWDPKLLLRCSTVCRRFASLTPRVHNVCLSLNRNGQILAHILGMFSTVKTFLMCFARNQNPVRRFSSFNHLLNCLDLSRPLSHFREIHHLHFEFPQHLAAVVVPNDSIKWGVSLSGGRIQSFAFVAVAKIYPIGQIPPIPSNEAGKDFRDLSRLVCSFAIITRILLLGLIRTQPVLRGVSRITVDFIGARRELGGERLVQLKETVSSIPCDSLWESVRALTAHEMKSFNKKLITLLVSGYVMEEMMLTVVEFNDCRAASGGGISEAAVLDCFEEEDNVYKEAVGEMLRDR